MGEWQDLRLVVRRMLTERRFTVVAVATLAIGIGAPSAVFSVVEALLMRPLPFQDSDRIVHIVSHRMDGATPVRTSTMALPFFLGLEERSQTLSAIGGYDSFSNVTRQRLAMKIDGNHGSAELLGTRMSPGLFVMLGVQPALGRFFEESESRPDRNGLVMLSHAVWLSHLGGEPDVLGRSLTLDGRLYSLVGVMPPEFTFPDRQTDFWIPLTPAPVPPPSAPRSDSPDSAYFDAVYGRLEDGAALQAAAAEVELTLRQLDLETAADQGLSTDMLGFPVSMPRRAELVSMKEELVAPVRPALRAWSFAAGLVWLIACVNVVNLLLTRTAARQGEFALRAALGAGGGRLTRQVLTESLVLAVAGGCVGMALAFSAVQVIKRFAPSGIPRLDEVGLDMTVLLFALGVSSLSGLAVGLVPALRVAKADRGGALTRVGNTAAPGSGLVPFGARGIVVVGEIAMATVLFIGAGLLIRSFVALVNVSPGYDARNVLTFQVVLPSGRDANPGEFHEELLTRLGSIPTVQAAGATDVLPIVGSSALHYTLGGLPIEPGQTDRMVMRVVSGGYFRAMGIRVLAGRGFSDGDVSGGNRDLLVSREFSRRYFGTESPLGRTVGVEPTRYEVVGVVDDVRHAGLSARVEPEYYVPLRQYRWQTATRPYFVARTRGNPLDLASTVRSLVRQIDPQAGVDLGMSTMADIVSESVARPRFNTMLASAFAAIAVGLAAIGIYGVMAYSVAQRTREIGIRLTLGALHSDVLRLIMRQSAAATAGGIMVGLAGAVAVTRYLEGMLFGLTPLDVSTFVGVSVIFAAVAMLASYIPARRATKIEALTAIRYE